MSQSTAVDAADALRRGELVVVWDDVVTGQSDIVGAAETALVDQVAFAVKYGSGFVCVALPEARAQDLVLPRIAGAGYTDRRPAFAVSVDADAGITTGISAHDRALTIARLGDPRSVASDFRRPGHTVPIRVQPAESLAATGSPGVAMDLAASAGRAPAAFLATIVSAEAPSDVAAEEESRRFAEAHGLAMTSVSAVRDHFNAELVHGDVPEIVRTGGTRMLALRTSYRSIEHAAISFGPPNGGGSVTLAVVRECPWHRLFGDAYCSCGAVLRERVRLLRHAQGALVYLRAAGTAPAAQLVGPHYEPPRPVPCAQLAVRPGLGPGEVEVIEALREELSLRAFEALAPQPDATIASDVLVGGFDDLAL